MKKVLSILLSAMLILSTMTVLMMLPASATTTGVATITAAEGGVVSTDSVDVGTATTIVATPYFGNTFAGWYDSEGRLVSKQATYTGTITDSLTARFNVLNQIVDGSFENGTAGQDYFNLASGSNAGKNNVIADTPTPGNALHGDKVLACTPTAAANTAQYLIYMPLTVKKNTQYAFHMSFYMPTTSVWKYIGLYGNNDGYANSWTAYGTLAAWSYDYCAESQTGGVDWRYNGNQSASTLFAKEMANTTMGADAWQHIWILIDTGDDATIFPDGDTGKIYLSFGTLNDSTDTFYIDNVSFAEVTDTQATYTATAGEGGSVTADGDVVSSLRSVCHYNTSGSIQDDAGSNHMVADSTRYSQSVTAVKRYTAVADEGYTFDGWYDDTDNLVSTNATAELLMYGNYTAKFAQSVSAGEGGVVNTDSVNAGTETTLVATPYYGNTFAGWYNSQDQLVSTQATYTGTITDSLTAKFNVLNQIVDGSFESPDQAGVNYINTNSPIGNGRGNVLRDLPSGSNAVLHGSKALYCKPTSVSTATTYIARYTVTVEKNKNYVFHYSYYDDNAVVTDGWPGYDPMKFTAQAAKGNPGCWENAGKPAWQTLVWKSESDTVYSGWPGWTQNDSVLFLIDRRTAWTDKDSYRNNWVDAWYYFNAGEDSTIFADGEETAQIHLMIGHGNSNDYGFYLDNVSFTEAVNTPNGAVSATAEVGGSVKVNQKTPISVDRLQGTNEKDKYTDYVIAGTTAYSNIAVTEYTAVPDEGYAFAGWYDADGNCVSTDASTGLYTPGTYTAKFAQPVSAGEGGVLTDNGDGTVTAKPHYGNTFAGWYKDDVKLTGGEYDTDTVTKEGNVGVVAKFGAYNQIVDGSFENGGNPTYLTGSATSQVMTDTDGNKFVRVTSGQNFTAFSYRFNVEQNKKYLVSYKLRDGMDENGNKLSGANAIIRRQIRPVKSAGTDYDWAGLHFASQSGYTFGSLINTYNSAADLLPKGGFYLNPVDLAPGADYLEKYVRSDDEWVTYSYILDATTLSADSTNLFAGGNTAQLGIVLGVFDTPTAVMDIDDVLVSEITDADIYPTIGANPADGSGTYTMTAPAATAGLPVSYIAYPSQFYTFDGWYNDSDVLVSTDTVYAPSSPIALTPKFSIHYRDVNETGVGNFEGGVDPHYIAKTRNDVKAELAAYSNTEKDLNGYNDDLGDTYLKVTTPNNGNESHTDISFPVNVTADEKYIAHFKLFVSYSLANDSENDEAVLADSSRFDFRVTAGAVSWDAPNFVIGDVSVANGKDIYNKDTVANGLYLNWFGATAQSKYGNSIVDAYAVIEATGTGTIYLTVGLRNGGVYGIDNVTFVNVNDMAPTMVGATMNTDVEDGNEIMYVTNVNVPSYVALNKIATYMAPTTKLAAAYPERVSNFAEDLGEEYVGTATLVANNRTGTIDVKGGATFRSGDVYSSFVGAAAVTQTNKYSVRSVISLTDAYGNDLGVSVATQNTNSASKIENGVYTRSIAQVKRLNAKYYIENGYDALAAEMITPVDGKPLYNCDLAQVWDFVKEAAKKAAAN